jgi:hypothetical protein
MLPNLSGLSHRAQQPVPTDVYVRPDSRSFTSQFSPLIERMLRDYPAFRDRVDNPSGEDAYNFLKYLIVNLFVEEAQYPEEQLIDDYETYLNLISKIDGTQEGAEWRAWLETFVFAIAQDDVTFANIFMEPKSPVYNMGAGNSRYVEPDPRNPSFVRPRVPALPEEAASTDEESAGDSDADADSDGSMQLGM